MNELAGSLIAALAIVAIWPLLFVVPGWLLIARVAPDHGPAPARAVLRYRRAVAVGVQHLPPPGVARRGPGVHHRVLGVGVHRQHRVAARQAVVSQAQPSLPLARAAQ